jgi:hypothetical protein
MAVTLLAGVAAVTISPAIGARLIGFAARPGSSEWLRDELTATALVLDDGTSRVAILACDLCFIHPTMLRKVRALVAAGTGIDQQALLVCCSHTHSGPLTYVREGGWALDRAYIDHLPYLLAGAVAAAARAVQPVRLRVGHGTGDIAANRRRPRADGRVEMEPYADGPLDSDVAVVRLETPSGKPVATLVNYACHPTILGPRSLAISADYVGETRRLVTQETGAPCLFLQGACADINPLANAQADDASVATLGGRLGQAALAAWAEAGAVVESPLGVRTRELTLPLAESWHPPGDDRLEEVLSQLYRDGAEGPPLTPQNVSTVMDERLPWAAELGRDEDAGRQTISVEVSVWRAGDLAVAAIAGEPFVETGLAIKGGSQVPHTLVAGYTNGCPGYLPPRAEYPRGGYEVDEAYRWYRLPTPPAPGCAERIVEEALELLSATSPS